MNDTDFLTPWILLGAGIAAPIIQLVPSPAWWPIVLPVTAVAATILSYILDPN